RVEGERRPAVRTTAEAIDLQRTLREMLEAGDRSCAMEASSHGSALRRLDGLRFACLVFTNLTQDHLDFHGTLERYYQAKRRLFGEEEGPPAAINVGDAYGRRLLAELWALGRRPLLTFGLTEEADIHPQELELGPGGSSFVASGLELKTRLLGRFNVENVLAAVAAARLLGLPDQAIQAGVAAGFLAASRRWTKASPSRWWSTTRTRPPPSPTCLPPPATSLAAGSSASLGAAEIATEASGRSWALSPPRLPTSASSPPTTRAARIRTRSSPTSCKG
ncbi:MAG: hypothetical protein C4305_07365, partial [Thermoleophilia bacterium]